jgi:hypothetical protein
MAKKTANWLTTTEALEQIPLSRYELIMLVKAGHLKHGVHYLDKRRPDSRRATYLWNPEKVMDWLSNNPERR